MDGRGRWMDNVFIEPLWRSMKYECVYLHAFETGSEANRRTRERELAAVERKVAGILKAIEDGLYHESMKERLTSLEADKARLLATGDGDGAELPSVLLHPQLSDLYRRKVEALEVALAGGEDSAEAMEMVRIMIDRVVLTPSPTGARLDADRHGELAGVLAVCESTARMGKTQTHERPGSFEPGRQVSVVAGAGFEPAAFRL